MDKLPCLNGHEVTDSNGTADYVAWQLAEVVSNFPNGRIETNAPGTKTTVLLPLLPVTWRHSSGRGHWTADGTIPLVARQPNTVIGSFCNGHVVTGAPGTNERVSVLPNQAIQT